MLDPLVLNKLTSKSPDDKAASLLTKSDKIIKHDRDIWITVPTLNEAKNIQTLMKDIEVSMDGLQYHVCIVDDGSKDKTLGILNSYMQNCKSDLANNIHVIQRKKTAKGSQRAGATVAGFRFGLQHSDCKIFVDMDADLAHSPNELGIGIQAIQEHGFDVAIASKYLPESRVLNRPWTRIFLSYIYNWLWRRLVDNKISDYSNGYRFYNRESVEEICKHKLKYDGPVGLCQILVMLLSKGRKITEFPTVYLERNEGISKLTWIDIVKAGAAMLNISFRYHLRKKQNLSHSF